MHKVLIAYFSRTGKTEKMANLIAEGIRFTGNEAIIRKISEITSDSLLEGYDGYIFGCPTYHRDMTAGMKTFLFMAERVNLLGKIGGAFGSYTHSGEASPMIYDTMKFVYKMDTTDLGPLSLKEALIETHDGVKACQDYGKAIGEMFKK
ncbi:MAG: nitric oxide synthase [Deltaproteobacteria bacterium CG_4_8_14_3_um_filter_51_11]|nr:nitric oxide synthase [bacterium]OIP39754.1 MAG: nitric oxide synthase [Desulfobacteraceae bacterium CG2_30_51_40]PIP45953.1 MAG: nitric oxide synthase [Deltaproteobacteria bacterium CG23_combo_of_CG06-09_8_20_14_all_51_20]PIX19995.1 MAG: nitric oxide synthase [Deltaproteobacteria bacterium CG_4_8_14_3_um_filter_51_11]PIY26503.1 MAG: nitric oxide synthase [Deltaproteobacteria bacterium CG_4_10_14_3_um_filter_51_14]PJB38245.1 MAG: nitric oxide synthase [Deltaproteobacteria bacterium CG_4_9_1